MASFSSMWMMDSRNITWSNRILPRGRRPAMRATTAPRRRPPTPHPLGPREGILALHRGLRLSPTTCDAVLLRRTTIAGPHQPQPACRARAAHLRGRSISGRCAPSWRAARASRSSPPLDVDAGRVVHVRVEQELEDLRVRCRSGRRWRRRAGRRWCRLMRPGLLLPAGLLDRPGQPAPDRARSPERRRPRDARLSVFSTRSASASSSAGSMCATTWEWKALIALDAGRSRMPSSPPSKVVGCLSPSRIHEHELRGVEEIDQPRRRGPPRAARVMNSS